jgi:uncharacterized protein (DUF697 family)
MASDERPDADPGASGPRSGPAVATSPTAPTAGRLAILSGFAVAASAIPIPFVPERLVATVRGSVVQDVASRHGLSLTRDARMVLAQALGESPARLLAKRVIGVLSKTLLKRVGPLGLLTATATSLEVFALGHLFERWIERHRGSPSVRIHEAEARRVRAFIDRATVHALSPSVTARQLPASSAVEDLRDEMTKYVDAVLLATAGLPGWVVRRLDASFDEVVAAEGASLD